MRKRLVSITLCTGWQLHARRSCEDLPWWRCRSRRWRLGQTGWSSGTRVEWPAAKGKHKRWEGQLHSYISKSSFLDPNGAGGFFLGGGEVTMCLFSALLCLIQRSWVRGSSVEMEVDRDSLLLAQVAPWSFRPEGAASKIGMRKRNSCLNNSLH